MANLYSIVVNSCDNELYIIATTGSMSSELLHLKSGYNMQVGTTIYPGAIIPAGSYELLLIGIDWGGAASFGGVLNFDDGSQSPFSLSQVAGQVSAFDAGNFSVVAP